MESLNLTREEFATRRRKLQDEFTETLMPLVKNAIPSGDWSKVLDQAKSMFSSLYTVERQTFAEGAEEDELDELLKALRSNLTHVNADSSPEVISLVIALAVMNAATQAAIGDQDGVEQEWVTMHDNKVRDAHAEADGQRRPIGHMFNVGGHPMPYPGWPTAPVELWINCRCVLRLAKVTELSGIDQEFGQTEPVQAGGDMEDVLEDEVGTEEPEIDVALAATPVPWHGVLAPEGIKSGDGRMFAEGSLRNRDLPLPLTWQKVSADGHNQNVTVGKIEKMQKIDGLVHASGHFLQTVESDEVIGLLADFGRFGVSVDADEAVAEYGDDEVLTFSDARISAACIVAIPAFAEAYVSLGYHPQLDAVEDDVAAALADALTSPIVEADAEAVIDEFREVSGEEREKRADDGTAMPDGSYPIANCEDLKNAIQAIGRAKDPEATKSHIRKRAAALECPDVELPETWAKSGIETGELVTAGRGPGWVTHPEETRRLHAYWTRGEGAAKIGWGSPGDFNRCRALVGEKIAANSPEDTRFLNQICAQWHHDAIGIWPGEHTSAQRIAELTSLGLTAAPAINIVASGGWCAPSEWFEDPKLTKPTSMSFREDERGTEVWGHLAEWGICHVGINGVCTVAPPSTSDYAYFMLGQVETDAGPRRVGNLTIGTGHAALRLGARPAAAHYDNTGSVWADVAVGEDEFGIWYHGWVRPGVTDEMLYAAKASGKVSGDWREIVRGSGELELIAALSVNVEGFNKTKPSVGILDGAQCSLVAAGVVDPAEEVKVNISYGLSEEDRTAIAKGVAAELKAAEKRAAKMAALKEKVGG